MITYDNIELGMRVHSKKWIDTTTMCHPDGYYKDTFNKIRKIEICITKEGEVKKLYPKKSEVVEITREDFNPLIFEND